MQGQIRVWGWRQDQASFDFLSRPEALSRSAWFLLPCLWIPRYPSSSVSFFGITSCPIACLWFALSSCLALSKAQCTSSHPSARRTIPTMPSLALPCRFHVLLGSFQELHKTRLLSDKAGIYSIQSNGIIDSIERIIGISNGKGMDWKQHKKRGAGYRPSCVRLVPVALQGSLPYDPEQFPDDQASLSGRPSPWRASRVRQSMRRLGGRAEGGREGPRVNCADGT